jgi:DNA primase large subunit
MVLDERTFTKYPFISDASQFLKNHDVTLRDLIVHPAFTEARSRGKSRVIDSLLDGHINNNECRAEYAIQEVASYPLARILVSATGDYRLINRYLLSEGKRLALFVYGDSKTDDEDEYDLMKQILDSLSIDQGSVVIDGKKYATIHFCDYLRITRGISGKEWKLVNCDLSKGYVRLDKIRMSRVIQQAYIERNLEQLPLPLNEEIIDSLGNDIQEVKQIAEEYYAKHETKEFGEVRLIAMPPCMKKVIAMAQNGQNIPHAGRFALATFLSHIGMKTEDIVRVFCSEPDFDNSKTIYQVRHLTGDGIGKQYTPPTCSTLRSTGVCFEPDRICEEGKIKHPLNYYRRKIYFSSQQEPVENKDQKKTTKQSK